jgi:hypothetical protein
MKIKQTFKDALNTTGVVTIVPASPFVLVLPENCFNVTIVNPTASIYSFQVEFDTNNSTVSQFTSTEGTLELSLDNSGTFNLDTDGVDLIRISSTTVPIQLSFIYNVIVA